MVHGNKIILPKEEINKLYFEEGLTIQEIADKYYVCKDTLAKAIDRPKHMHNHHSRNKYYKNKYLIFLWDENDVLVRVFNHPKELSEFLNRPIQYVWEKLSPRRLNGGIRHNGKHYTTQLVRA